MNVSRLFTVLEQLLINSSSSPSMLHTCISALELFHQKRVVALNKSKALP